MWRFLHRNHRCFELKWNGLWKILISEILNHSVLFFSSWLLIGKIFYQSGECYFFSSFFLSHQRFYLVLSIEYFGFFFLEKIFLRSCWRLTNMSSLSYHLFPVCFVVVVTKLMTHFHLNWHAMLLRTIL